MTSMRLPAEWEPQQLVLFTFPRQDGDWASSIDAASAAMITAANAVNKVTPTLLLVADEKHFGHYAETFKGEVLTMPTDDCWIRDYGPITTIYGDEALVLNHFTFNGWGEKFDAKNDDAVTQRLWRAEFPEAGYRRSNIVLEGGSLESDGKGTIMTTRKCWMSKNRNEWTTTEAAEAALEEYFDFDRILWLEHGELSGDDTDAHVDTLARFLDETTIAYVQCDDPADEHFPELEQMEAELKAFRTPAGEPYKLLPLPWPPAVLSREDQHRLPATYANFLISNGTLFLPTYFDEEAGNHPGRLADERAITMLSTYGKYRVVPLPCRAFIEQHGSLHCLTMQVPKLGE
jgi:agmatine deiminase